MTAEHDPIAAGSQRARPAPDGRAVDAPPIPHDADGWSFVPLLDDGPFEDLARVADWMRTPHVAERWGQAWSDEAWRAEVRAQLAGDHSRPLVAHLDGRSIAYVELYRPHLDVLASAFPTEPSDLGVHLAIGPADAVGRGVGPRLLRAVAAGAFLADPTCRRVLGDPARDHPTAQRAFQLAGYQRVGEATLDHKVAVIHVHPRP